MNRGVKQVVDHKAERYRLLTTDYSFNISLAMMSFWISLVPS